LFAGKERFFKRRTIFGTIRGTGTSAVASHIPSMGVTCRHGLESVSSTARRPEA
jgi:hypothetical protein